MVIEVAGLLVLVRLWVVGLLVLVVVIEVAGLLVLTVRLGALSMALRLRMRALVTGLKTPKREAAHPKAPLPAVLAGAGVGGEGAAQTARQPTLSGTRRMQEARLAQDLGAAREPRRAVCAVRVEDARRLHQSRR